MMHTIQFDMIGDYAEVPVAMREEEVGDDDVSDMELARVPEGRPLGSKNLEDDDDPELSL